MPKKLIQESVLHDWVHSLPFQMQALLLTAMRGPDENNKYNAAKAIIRYLRAVVIKPADSRRSFSSYSKANAVIQMDFRELRKWGGQNYRYSFRKRQQPYSSLHNGI